VGAFPLAPALLVATSNIPVPSASRPSMSAMTIQTSSTQRAQDGGITEAQHIPPTAFSDDRRNTQGGLSRLEISPLNQMVFACRWRTRSP
jgi:hypothetical protein